MTRRTTVLLGLPALVLALLAGGPATTSAGAVDAPAAARSTPPPYVNPLDLRDSSGRSVESCADPTVLDARDSGDGYWYLYCTTDPLSGQDRDGSGDLVFHLIPIFRSADLVHWSYVGDAFAQRPSWVKDDAGLWAPEIVTGPDGGFLLYFGASDTDAGGSAIGVAHAEGPAGPWVDSGAPVVGPMDARCCPGAKRWTFDPEVVEHEGQRYLYFGSYFGGIDVVELTASGTAVDPDTQVQVATDNRYEGAQVVRRGGWFYLLASATDCCRGPLTGYSVFAGRSDSPVGPFVDRDGASLMAGRTGGSVALSMNGNRWVGPGHHDVLTDFGGQQWIVYHAIDRHAPYFDGAVGFTKRPALLDPLDWVDGWPTVRAGGWASDTVQPGPAARPGQRSAYRARPPRLELPAETLGSDGFDGGALSGDWSWVREPAGATYEVANGVLRWRTQAGDLHQDSNSASVLTRPAPDGDYTVQVKVGLDVPAEGCCFNYVQAGLVAYGGDDAFVKLATASIWNTRQNEMAKEVPAGQPGYPRYGNTVAGPPGEHTWLRLTKRDVDGEERYTAWTSLDGESWQRGGTWTHRLGEGARIGLVAMGGEGFTAEFDDLVVSSLRLGGG